LEIIGRTISALEYSKVTSLESRPLEIIDRFKVITGSNLRGEPPASKERTAGECGYSRRLAKSPRKLFRVGVAQS